MSHRYSHVTSIEKIDDEMLKLKLKKEIIRNEFGNHVDEVRKSVFTGSSILSLVIDLFSSAKSDEEVTSDTFDKAVEYTGLAAQILTVLNSLRR